MSVIDGSNEAMMMGEPLDIYESYWLGIATNRMSERDIQENLHVCAFLLCYLKMVLL